MSGLPDPKSRSLARGERRYRRKVASPKQWQAIIAAKTGPCRACVAPATNGGYTSSPKPIEFHHLISRAQGGDDVEDNIVPLCPVHHRFVTERMPLTLAALAASLTDSEYAYVVGKLGESGPARLFGVGTMTGRESLIPAPFERGDVVLCDGRQGWIHEPDPWPTGGIAYVIFDDRTDGQPIGEPWSALAATDLWRCSCPRLWRVATAPTLSCEKCGATRGLQGIWHRG